MGRAMEARPRCPGLIIGKMTITTLDFIKRGYTPLACNGLAGIAWEGEPLPDFWMWNQQFSVDDNGASAIQTVQVTDLTQAALRYWKDGWVPIKPVDDRFLRRMEAALRKHKGLKREGRALPDTPFLRPPDEIPDEYLSATVRRYLRLPLHGGKDE